MKIIVSRYNEDMGWTKQFDNIIIFNKGGPLDIDYNEIKLDNVGREQHTFYKYIVDNYDNLDDFTAFLQGFPFDHYPNIINTLQKYIEDENIEFDFKYLSDYIFDCNLSGCSHHPGIPLSKVYNELFEDTKTELPFKFGAGGQFIVSKKQIHKKPKEFYMKIVKMLQTNICPIEGYVIERFGNLIFT